ncbi:PREDICTED: putative F-box protein At1g30930 [Camelina sativa]|uniref:F-box protein At1g30930 n=1 Tax=Camelina sativa TaxID=90675 RepID=A0ABM1R649_CAMSA|nr:PREDICTED: putative F-box protein At1g30930 [Camelina sativa]
MVSGKTFDSIPDELIIEIFSRLTTKSIARCRCVSKLWNSLAPIRSGFHRHDFTELFLTKSSARPRLLIGVGKYSELRFYSTLQPQPQNSYEKLSSPVVAATEFHTKFSIGISEYKCSYTSGLIYFHNMRIPRDDEDVKRVICNPLTGQYVILPQLRGASYSYLGFDPVNKEFKVLFMSSHDTDHYILTLGTGELRWRKIQCPFTHDCLWGFEDSVCINGVLHYLAYVYDTNDPNGCSKRIVCFDVRSEKFKLVDRLANGYEGHFDGMINYKGKLCGLHLDYAYDGEYLLKLTLRVLEDVEKPEWSNYVYSLSADHSEVFKVKEEKLSVVGVTASGEIVLARKSASALFDVFYFNPEINTLQSV